MDFATLLPLLALFTLLAVAVLALVSKARTEARLRDPAAPASSLAKDHPSGGAFGDGPARPSDLPPGEGRGVLVAPADRQPGGPRPQDWRPA